MHVQSVSCEVVFEQCDKFAKCRHGGDGHADWRVMEVMSIGLPGTAGHMTEWLI